MDWRDDKKMKEARIDKAMKGYYKMVADAKKQQNDALKAVKEAKAEIKDLWNKHKKKVKADKDELTAKLADLEKAELANKDKVNTTLKFVEETNADIKAKQDAIDKQEKVLERIAEKTEKGYEKLKEKKKEINLLNKEALSQKFSSESKMKMIIDEEEKLAKKNDKLTKLAAKVYSEREDLLREQDNFKVLKAGLADDAKKFAVDMAQLNKLKEFYDKKEAALAKQLEKFEKDKESVAKEKAYLKELGIKIKDDRAYADQLYRAAKLEQKDADEKMKKLSKLVKGGK